MKYSAIKYILFLCIVVISASCSTDNETDGSSKGYIVQGRIMDVKDNEILVANVIPRDVALNYTTNEVLGDDTIQPIYVNVPDDITNYKKGQLVKAWLKKDESVKYSVPAKGNAEKIEILSEVEK
ncbi:DUF3221 domain-containing protein [Priestia megaterium]|nr:DUF3221 domain-containing protein [Priestia megaterium]